jgi:hypothetical protein
MQLVSRPWCASDSALCVQTFRHSFLGQLESTTQSKLLHFKNLSTKLSKVFAAFHNQ